MPDVGPGEVLVRVSRTALCGSDFKLWHKGAEFTAGHEIFGVVEQPGHRLHGRRCAIYILALQPLRRLRARRHADVPGSLQPDRLEQAGRLCRICAGAGKLPAAGALMISRTALRRCCSTPSAPRGHAVALRQPRSAAERGRCQFSSWARGLSALASCWRSARSAYDDIYVADPNATRLKIAQSFGAKAHPSAIPRSASPSSWNAPAPMRRATSASSWSCRAVRWCWSARTPRPGPSRKARSSAARTST